MPPSSHHPASVRQIYGLSFRDRASLKTASPSPEREASPRRPRLQPGGAVILIQTRWHHDDLAGWLLREHPEENWEILNLPALAEVD